MVNPFKRFFQERKRQVDKDVESFGSPSEKETAVAFDSLFLRLDPSFERYNPDELVQRKGHRIYRKMLRDDQVKASYNLLINIIISRQHTFEKRSDDPIQDEIIDFFNHNITISIEKTWLSALRTVLLGKAHGYSVSEKIWQIEDIDGKDWWTIRQIKSKPYETFSFKVDEFGNLEKLMQHKDGSVRKLDLKKFIIYVANPELDPIWGESDLRAAYRPYWEKDINGKFWNIWSERSAGGFTVIKPGKDAPQLSRAEKTNLENTIKNIQQMTGVILPREYELENFKVEDTDAFEKIINSKNRAISRSLLVPNLLGFSEEGKFGSRALGDVQFEMFMQLVSEQGDYLAEVMNEQFFSQLAWWNFGIKDYPRYRFENFTVEERRMIAEAWTDAVNKGSVVNTFDDESHTRQLLLYPEREESENDSKDEDTDREQEVLEQSDIEFTSLTFTDRVNFGNVENIFDRNQEAFVTDMAQSVDEMMVEVKSAMRAEFSDVPENRKTINYDKINKNIQGAILPGTKSKLNQAAQKNLANVYISAREEAKRTIEKSLRKAPEDIKKRVKLSLSLSRKVATKDEKWSLFHFVEGINLETAENYFKSKSFSITGDISGDILAMAGRIFTEGIRDEKSITEIIKELENVLPTLVGTRDPETGKIDKQERARLETIARTNISTVFNQAQLAVYNDPALGDFVVAYEYSAVLDSRTTKFCRTYDDRVYAKNDPIWGTITPPNHFNCRSVIIPVTTLDEWEPSRVNKSVQPAKGFGGEIK